jgi:DNA-binding LacI/PurR family transcriptional regulator
MSQKKRATLYDVAAAAGVSHQTVSRVLHQHPNVSLKTRRKVQKVIDELGFVPNKAAQMLTLQRSYTLEMITTTLYGTATATLAALVDAASQQGYHFTFHAVALEEVNEVLQATPARIVDGTILHMPNLHITVNPPPQLAMIQMAGEPSHPLSSVYIDQRAGAQRAVQHLIALGHRQIVHLRGLPYIYDSQVRYETWQTTLQQAGLTAVSAPAYPMNCEGGYAAVLALLDSATPFTALFAANDLMALGAMRALHDRGVRVPEAVSVVGFDDLPSANFALPRLTTVRQSFYELGQLAVAMLLEKIENPATPIYQRVLVPELIVRESTRPFP